MSSLLPFRLQDGRANGTPRSLRATSYRSMRSTLTSPRSGIVSPTSPRSAAVSPRGVCLKPPHSLSTPELNHNA